MSEEKQMASRDEQGDRRESNLTALARLVALHAPYDGVFELRRPGVYAIRVSRPATERTHTIQRPSVCITAQGAKSVMVGDDVYEYAAGRVAVYSIDVPVSAQITRANAAEPYLNLKIDLDLGRVAELATRVYPHGLPQTQNDRAVYVGDADPHVVDAATRLIEQMAHPADAELLAPLTTDEILIRLLRGPMGSRIAQIAHANSGVQRIGKAVSWLRANLAEPVHVEDLAKMVNMSVSSFHRQFKDVTGVSPLQYQKTLRLLEARRLMLTNKFDAGTASRVVGYQSASQFTREYGRFFGAAPVRDINRLRVAHVEERRVEPS